MTRVLCRWWLFGALALVAPALSGCDLFGSRTAASLTYTEDARKAYGEAMEAYDDRNWQDARSLFSEVKRLFPYSPYAKLAELRIADVDFEQGKFTDAIAGYRGYVKGHRGDKNVEYAKYRVAKALFLDINDTLLLPPQEERDQANALDAFRELKAFNRRYPQSRYRVDAEYMMEVVTQRLVRHELYVARYYLDRDNFEATVARVDYALDNYSGSGLDAEALVLKGETLLKMHKPDEARVVFHTVIRDHGGPFGRIAKRFLDAMPGGAGTAGEPATPAQAEEPKSESASAQADG
jgi:outer membrane protein assembly factor BamD